MNILNTSRHLAVVGDPIDHSKSPQLHTAAYRLLGLDWEYQRRRVSDGQLAAFVGGLDSSWRGLSVTMPLKSEAFALASTHDDASALTRVANTLVFNEHGGNDRTVRAFNTDVLGLVNPLRRMGVDGVNSGTIVGSGATAMSAVVALSGIGCAEVTVATRNESSAREVVDLAGRLGMRCEVVPLTHLGDVEATPVTISTIPGNANVSLASRVVTPGDVLFDIAYDVWPSLNATSWTHRNGRVISGLSMLAAQALEQVRLFVLDDGHASLDREDEVRHAMNSAVGLDESGLIVRSVG